MAKTFAAALFVMAAAALFVSVQDELVTFEINGTVTTDESLPVINATMQLSFMKMAVDENEIPQTVDENQVVVTNDEGKYSFNLNIEDLNDAILNSVTNILGFDKGAILLTNNNFNKLDLIKKKI